MPTTKRAAVAPLVDVLVLVGRLCRESLSSEPPYLPLHPVRPGSCLVDRHDLADLARAYHQLEAARDAVDEHRGEEPA